MSNCPKCGAAMETPVKNLYMAGGIEILRHVTDCAECLRSQLQAERAAHEVTRQQLCDVELEAVRLQHQLSEAHQPLKDLLDSDMPTDLVGAVNYIIDHSNKGWSQAVEYHKQLDAAEQESRNIIIHYESCNEQSRQAIAAILTQCDCVTLPGMLQKLQLAEAELAELRAKVAGK